MRIRYWPIKEARHGNRFTGWWRITVFYKGECVTRYDSSRKWGGYAAVKAALEGRY